MHGCRGRSSEDGGSFSLNLVLVVTQMKKRKKLKVYAKFKQLFTTGRLLKLIWQGFQIAES